MVLTGLLALTSSTAMAEILEYDTERDELRTGAGCSTQVLDTSFENDELSANEQIMADAWKSHIHARKAAALEGTD